LRNRRRYTTQTIQRKKRSSVSSPAYPRKTKSSSSFFRFFILLIFIVALVYLGIKYIYPVYLEFASQVDSTAANIAEESGPDFPVEDNTLPITEYRTPIPEKVQVEVLNGCGESGIAKFLADRLRASNYDVVNMGNYIKNGKTNWEVEKTQLIDQIGLIEQARNLGELMGVDYAQVETFENPSPIADITIVIGKDYAGLNIFEDLKK